MKKIITTLLLLAFCTVQTTFAREVIIIGSDGQARWENETKQEEITQDVIKNTKPKNIINEFTITDDSNQGINVYVDYKGRIRSSEENKKAVIDIIKQNTDKQYKNIVKQAQKEIKDAYNILMENGYSIKDNKYDNGRTHKTVKLLDGDYVKCYKGCKYFAEYHKNGELMGLIRTEEKNKNLLIFYEYRIGYHSTTGMGLKHIMFLSLDNEKQIVQYIYNDEAKLLCGQNGNNIYISQDARNMITSVPQHKEITRFINYKKKVDEKHYNEMYEMTKLIVLLPFEFIGAAVIAFKFALWPFFLQDWDFIY